ncbi:MAG: indole-3-glycerol phosphate synthase TrpC [Lactobacillus sp.]|jgi:indole-3-glycerol phosphate synthase|nr:indole-3-glycerol phosphate synthase TrpC [Lactobacillus sp.]
MILDDLVAATKRRLKIEKQTSSLKAVQQCAKVALKTLPAIDFAAQLKQPGLHIIGELKQASPSKGQIVTDFPYMAIAKAYDEAGVDAISVLTEPAYFKGSLTYLDKVSKITKRPLLRKDFTIDPYMIYQAKANGAAIILLIVAILDDQQLKDYLQLAHDLQLNAIVEVHNEAEVKRALAAGAKIIGINNRNLKNFTVNVANSLQLKNLIPADVAVIAESGLKKPADLIPLKQAGFDGILIGEALMRAEDKAKMVQQFKEVAYG